MCRIFARTNGMEKEEWLRLRKKGIGGSDAGAVCGLNPYRSPMDVYFDKTKEEVEELEDNEAMRQGRELEEYVARRFSEETGLKVRRANMMYQSKEHPFMLADVDRMVVGKQNGIVGLECKTVSPYSAEKWKDGNIPAQYLCQCYHYMKVLDADSWYIAALVYGKDFIIRKIERDEDIIHDIVKLEERFWRENVLSKAIPEPDGSRSTDEFINRYFADSLEGSSMPLFGFDEKLKRRNEISELIDRLNTEKNQIEEEVKLYMKETEVAENNHYIVSWKKSIQNRIDSRRLKEEMPEVYERFTRPVASRRFLVRMV